jgi:Bacterial PH domain
VNYDDGRVACTDDALVIRWYYFPFGTKRIRYADIEKVQRLSLTVMNGRWRMWGSNDFVHWANLDAGRPAKAVAFVVYLSSQRVRPVITPDNPDEVAAALAWHGVNVS